MIKIFPLLVCHFIDVNAQFFNERLYLRKAYPELPGFEIQQIGAFAGDAIKIKVPRRKSENNSLD